MVASDKSALQSFITSRHKVLASVVVEAQKPWRDSFALAQMLDMGRLAYGHGGQDMWMGNGNFNDVLGLR